ncbi:DUF1418 family protein [Escherichia coli]|uniref:DUF1418 family protein n=1 Tax=Escherichia coli TaxID=562 RepID=UPI001FCE932F|nr:DUF1418 family protein [Escherichia coli]
MRAIGKLPKGVLILEFIGMMLLAVALLSVSDYLSLPEPFSRPEVQILMIFLGVLLMLPAAVVVILQVAKRLAGSDSNLLIVFYVQIMPDDLVMQLHRF